MMKNGKFLISYKYIISNFNIFSKNEIGNYIFIVIQTTRPNKTCAY